VLLLLLVLLLLVRPLGVLMVLCVQLQLLREWTCSMDASVHLLLLLLRCCQLLLELV
jgi:hypothetical protein